MELKAGFEKEYQKRHAEIWPELEHVLKDAGICEYSIFLDEKTNTLFAFQKVEGNRGSQNLANNSIVKKWWDYMSDIMEVNPDNAPVVVGLKEVFHQD